jgi:hypothetical protein
MTTTLFQPSTSTNAPPFQCQATLTGPTANVTSTDTVFTVVCTWNIYGQRWYVTIYDADNNMVVNRPLIGSPSIADVGVTVSPINLVGGYFTGSQLVYYEDTQQFVVTP